MLIKAQPEEQISYLETEMQDACNKEVWDFSISKSLHMLLSVTVFGQEFSEKFLKLIFLKHIQHMSWNHFRLTTISYENRWIKDFLF